MNYSHYPEYKDSEVSWLREIPRHWHIKRLKFSTELINHKVNVEDSNLPYFGLEHIESWTGRKIEGEIANSEGGASKFSSGDVLFGKLRPYLAKVHLAKQEGLISSEALVIRSKSESHPEFLKYYILSHDFINIVDSSTYGSKMPRASWDFIGNLPILLPDLEEQGTIARFLDYKTAQIDALIAKKQALLAKLAEKRTALISHAVTKGLDPSVPMKDSGVEWLGEIPAHWLCPPLYSRYTIELGKMLNESRISGKYLVPYLRNVDVQWNEVNTQDLPVMDIRPDEFSRYLVRSGDLLVCEGGEVGRAAIVGDDAGLLGYQKALHRLRCIDVERESSRFMFYTLSWAANSGLFLAEGNPNTIPHLTGEKLRRYRFPCPPIVAQKMIAHWLDEQCETILKQQRKIIHVIEILKEYRASLITHAVTGKIVVHDFVVPEPAQESNPATLGKLRRSGMDCRNPEAMDGESHSHPCDLDTGTNLPGADWHLPEGRQAGEPDVTPCRYDGLT